MTSFGSNLGFVDEMYDRYLADPQSVSEAWRQFFADYHNSRNTPVSAPSVPKVQQVAAVQPAVLAQRALEERQELTGIAGKIAENMTKSLQVPTATSVRTIAVKVLEENRRILNQHQSVTGGPKVSFTHLIAFALVRALEKHPSMNASYVEAQNKGLRINKPAIHLGLAIDLERKGERVLLVPNIKNAQRMDFKTFLHAYENLVQRARANKLAPEEFLETSISLTNPGTLGTAMSVPRLMVGQGTIVGTGAIGYPAEYSGMAPEVISELGIAKTMTLTSTYDHRIIQGAQSGAFLATVEDLLLGKDSFYKRIFDDLRVSQEPLHWSADHNPRVLAGGGGGNIEAITKQANVLQLIRAYRVRGHLWANLDPLGTDPKSQPELELETYGLTIWDLDRQFIAGGLAGHTGLMSLREILDTLHQTYCRHVGVEYMHIPDFGIRDWLQTVMEASHNSKEFHGDDKKRILDRLTAAEAFENFLHTTYLGQKRFSLEGAETLIPMLDGLLTAATAHGMREAVIGMAHRGRLNVLANVVGKPYHTIFQEFEGEATANVGHGSGDVKYHLGAAGHHVAPDGASLSLFLASNPSHLEAVNPVVEGMVRARQDRLRDRERAWVLPILIHGDAAMSGQGVVGETFSLSQLKGYRTGGTIHVVVNNQIGFTTGPESGRSSLYCTDVAKMVHAPIFHVNADHPEAAVATIQLALEFRQKFKRDVVVDMICYRRWGHNEGDEPSYTQPALYSRIESHPSTRQLYADELVRRGILGESDADAVQKSYEQRLRQEHEQRGHQEPSAARDAINVASSVVRTAVESPALENILQQLEREPENFETHPKLKKQLAQRNQRARENKMEWGVAEALAFGSLVTEGVPVRLSGEDCGRGTFSQRHAMIYDHRGSGYHIPLAHLQNNQAPFKVYNSLLSEFGVLGFEYGFSIDYPEALILWEAQFGDFANGAQVIVDQFIAGGEAKWGQQSGLTLLLPHGYEGQGPEHSSARLERFLQLAADNNLFVCYPSTPAQYFHLLRRQAKLAHRRPLVVFTPKSLLRLPACVSTVSDLTEGAFQTVLEDSFGVDAKRVRRVLLCSGKVYYDLQRFRETQKIQDVAILRVEQLYPLDIGRLQELLRRYGSKEYFWVQEEPKNMGGFRHIAAALADTPELANVKLRYVGRRASAAPATGSHKQHLAEQEALVQQALT